MIKYLRPEHELEPAAVDLRSACIRNTSTQRQQVNPRRSQEIHLLALRASKLSSFKQCFALRPRGALLECLGDGAVSGVACAAERTNSIAKCNGPNKKSRLPRFGKRLTDGGGGN